MKPFYFNYGIKEETVDEKEENVILIEESQDENFCFSRRNGCFRDRKDIEKSSMDDFETNIFVLVDNVGGVRITAHGSYVFRIQEVDGGVSDMTGLRTTNLTKSKLISVLNDQFAI
ncbi:hypothetical protein AVEN_121735-1 [Araneus ventricosus]|uniref:Uncharacterized protein n=1 Tax=Araneus ventricosus TaxID=182803 RepID=A0A4Y2A8Q0_ARAVE|nr:hypothetical protein AVEN_121735-1 [Araneus ventricosus]